MIEILQNCIIFADKTHQAVTDKEVRDDAQIHIKNGEPLIFGKNRDKGIRLNGTQLEVVTLGENGITEDDLLVHDQYRRDWAFTLCWQRCTHLISLLHLA